MVNPSIARCRAKGWAAGPWVRQCSTGSSGEDAAAGCRTASGLSESGAPFAISDLAQRTVRAAATSIEEGLRRSGWLTRQRVRAYAIIVLLVEGVALVMLVGRAYDVLLPINPPLSFDYLSFYAAGDLTDQGAAALAYDEAIQGRTEKRIYGDPRIPYFGFYYPPIYELVCAGLAALPLIASYVIFMVASGAAYFAVLRRTIRDPVLTAAFAAFPAAFLSISLGQNSFLTTALLGGALLVLDRRPLLAGALFGAMSFKPHFLLLVPVALIAGRHWRALIVAAATAAALASLSLVALGSAAWRAWLTTTVLAQSVFATGRVGFYYLVNLFGAVRLIGGSTELAIAVQAMALLVATVALAMVWWGSRNQENSRGHLGRRHAGRAAGGSVLRSLASDNRDGLADPACPAPWLFAVGKDDPLRDVSGGAVMPRHR